MPNRIGLEQLVELNPDVLLEMDNSTQKKTLTWSGVILNDPDKLTSAIKVIQAWQDASVVLECSQGSAPDALNAGAVPIRFTAASAHCRDRPSRPTGLER